MSEHTPYSGTFHGGCHCGAVRFRAQVDPAQGSVRCNCSLCARIRRWAAILAPSAFELLEGEDALADYRFGRGVARHRFCRHCGVHVFAQNHVEELGGDYVSLSLACLDVAPQWLAAVPVAYLNGRDEDWERPPAVTAHM
ncbi:GFA family protein [Lysobacter yananisis]|uniref:GFA family protein n=1 Tax=Lysobacter yananisis TaxID=1003114 RepID=A0ABY9PDZ7_9GAMM|nr:GFA family protein [Lysobacter yananisis]WMT04995.1 GFA family protein [Lysobacter yananisis]